MIRLTGHNFRPERARLTTNFGSRSIHVSYKRNRYYLIKKLNLTFYHCIWFNGVCTNSLRAIVDVDCIVVKNNGILSFELCEIEF